MWYSGLNIWTGTCRTSIVPNIAVNMVVASWMLIWITAMDMVGVRKYFYVCKNNACSLRDCMCSGIWHMLFLGSLNPFQGKILRWELFIRELMENENQIPFPPYSLCIFLFNIHVYPKSLHCSMALPHHVHHCSSKSWIYQPGCINFLIENLFLYLPGCLPSPFPPNPSAFGASKELLRSY